MRLSLAEMTFSKTYHLKTVRLRRRKTEKCESIIITASRFLSAPFQVGVICGSKTIPAAALSGTRSSSESISALSAAALQRVR